MEANPSGLSQTVLYASEAMSHSHADQAYQETEYISIDSDQYVYKDWVVYEDSPFEISVVGMSISPFDFGLDKPKNEVLMYSLQRDHCDQGDDPDVLPIIHHDPLVDALGGSRPDRFIPIAASKSLFMASDGTSPRKYINCRFKIFELDDVTEPMRRSIAGIQQLGTHISGFLNTTPALGLLSPALSMASSVARQALDSHAKPDHVLTIDTNFLLAERKHEKCDNPHFIHQTGEYLRYGYYFFLSKKVDAKLYVSFKTFPNVELMMMRTDVDGLRPNEKKFFPLTGVSYVVLRVTRRLTTGRNTRKPVRLRHINRLEHIFKTAQAEGADAEHIRASLRELALEFGYVPNNAQNYQSQGYAQQSPAQATPLATPRATPLATPLATPRATPQATPQQTPQASPLSLRPLAYRPTENGLAPGPYEHTPANGEYQDARGSAKAQQEGAYRPNEGTTNPAEELAEEQSTGAHRDKGDYEGYGASPYDVDTGHGNALHGMDHEIDDNRVDSGHGNAPRRVRYDLTADRVDTGHGDASHGVDHELNMNRMDPGHGDVLHGVQHELNTSGADMGHGYVMHGVQHELDGNRVDSGHGDALHGIEHQYTSNRVDMGHGDALHGVQHDLNTNRVDSGHRDELHGVRHELNTNRVDTGHGDALHGVRYELNTNRMDTVHGDELHGVRHEFNNNRVDMGHGDALHGVGHQLNTNRVDMGHGSALHGVEHEFNTNRVNMGHGDTLHGVRHELNSNRVDMGHGDELHGLEHDFNAVRVDMGHGDEFHGVDHDEFDSNRASFVTRDAPSIGDSRISSEQTTDLAQMLWQGDEDNGDDRDV